MTALGFATATIPDVVYAMTHGELATALYHSGMPATGQHTAEEVLYWALQGMQRAGGLRRVRAIEQEILAALGSGDIGWFDEVNDRHFPLGERRQRAGDLADDLTRWLGVRKPEPKPQPDAPVRVPARPGGRPS